MYPHELLPVTRENLKQYCLRWVILHIALLVTAVQPAAKGQSILFSKLNTSHGLSNNHARSIAIDNNGFLWIGTSEGLNRYDGYTVTSWHPELCPSLASDVIMHLLCDKQNRIWVGTGEGVTWIDDERNFHRVTISDTLTNFYCPSIFETATYGVLLYTNHGQFYYDSTHHQWQQLDWLPQEMNATFVDAEPLSDDQIIFTLEDKVLILDYASRRILFNQPFASAVTACPAGNNQIAVGIENGKVLIINYQTGKTEREFRLTNELKNRTINSFLTEVRRAANGALLVATDYAGLTTIDTNGVLTRHTHDPIHQHSISANNTYRAFAGKRGEVVVGTYTSGANLGNVFNKPAGYTKIFKDKHGNLFDNFLNDIQEAEEDIFYIGSYDRLIRWNRKTNEAQFFYYYFNNGSGTTRALEIWTLCIDKKGRLLVGSFGNGLSCFDPRSGRFTKIKPDPAGGVSTTSNFMYDLQLLSDGIVWGASNGGIFTLHPETLAMDGLQHHPQLKVVNGKRVRTLYEDSRRRIWLGTGFDGLYCYDRNKPSIQHYTTAEGLSSLTICSIAEDKEGNIYVATPNGLNIVPQESAIKKFTRQNKLRYDRCESVVADDNGNIWISNNKCLIKYDPATQSWQYFEENAGLSSEGFRVSFTKAKSGELLFGSFSGLNYFHPGELYTTPSPMQVSLYAINVQDTAFRFSNDRYFAIPWTKNSITFHFTAINFNKPSNILYQYRLEGHEHDWHTVTDTREAYYNGLAAGNYTFRVRASIDGVNWINSNNTVQVYIVPPVWQRWWAIAGTVVLFAAFIYLLLQNRNRKIRLQKEQIETEQAINYFASSMHEQQKVDNILWDVARNCIGRLRFEDCVIYLLDEKRNVLVQKAAHGPKSPGTFIIHQPIKFR